MSSRRETSRNPAALPDVSAASAPLTGGLAVALIVLLVDLLVAKINLSIFYLVPLIYCARERHDGWMIGFGALLAVFGFAGYFFGAGGLMAPDVQLTELMGSFRMINRSLVAAAMAIILLLSWTLGDLRGRIDERREDSVAVADLRVYTEILESLRRAYALMAALLAAGLIFVADVFSQGEINLPILYALPLAILLSQCGRRTVLLALPAMLVLCALGYWLGPMPGPSEVWWVVRNRWLAAVTLVLLVLLVRPAGEDEPNAAGFGARLPG